MTGWYKNSKIKHTKLDHVFNAFNQNWLNMKWVFCMLLRFGSFVRCLFHKIQQSVVHFNEMTNRKSTKSNLIMPNFHLIACCKQTKPNFTTSILTIDTVIILTTRKKETWRKAINLIWVYSGFDFERFLRNSKRHQKKTKTLKLQTLHTVRAEK